NLKPSIAATIIEDRDAFRSEVPDLVSQEFNAQAPQLIEELFKNYVQSNIIQVHPTITTSTKTTSSADLQQQLDDDIHSQRHDNHQEDDAPLEGEKQVKRHKASKSSNSARGSSSKHSTKDSTTYLSKKQQQQEWDAWVEEIVIDEDEVILEDETPELIIELQDVNKRVPTIYDYARMKATLNDALSNQFKNAEEYAYHLEQTTNFMENQIVWESRQEDIRCPVPIPLVFFGPQRNPNEPPRYLYNKDVFFLKYGNTEEKKYILSLHKVHAKRFPEVDLEEKMNHWVRKEFNNFNEEARLKIQHWKDSWHKMIIVMRENDKPDSFSEVDFKYLNKNDIEDLYYLCQNKKVNYHETKLMNSLITFIKSRVIWDRVHDF
ncbi:hypothetical protein Tco_1395615, partial [Tanacetum coccineum]